jgi:hypothetical protein
MPISARLWLPPETQKLDDSVLFGAVEPKNGRQRDLGAPILHQDEKRLDAVVTFRGTEPSEETPMRANAGRGSLDASGSRRRFAEV